MTDDLTKQIKFSDFDLNENILQGITEAGFQIPSPIQAQAIPVVLQGHDIIGQAHTGTGKTAAFGLPCLNRIKHIGSVEMLVITPTRELATQVSDELFKLGKYADIHTATLLGGSSYSKQIEKVRQGVNVVVATPGRLLDLLESKRVGNLKPSMVVLDEADEMLDMGFLEDIQKIFEYLPKERQTLLFSATMPPQIKKLAQTILKDPKHIKVESQDSVNQDIEQQYYVIEEYERDLAIIRLIESQDLTKAIIFCRTKREVDELSLKLAAQGYLCASLHGDMEQNKRREVMTSFRKDKFNILIATDVAARGLDISDVSHVFNYHIPFNSESYVHRIGRTGRAGRKGVAITLVTPIEYHQLQRLQRVANGGIKLCTVPTINELKKTQLTKLVDTIRHQPLNEDANDMLELLEEEMDLSHIVYKLLSILIGDSKPEGPDVIGLSRNDLEHLQRSKTGNKGRGSGRRSGGGSSRYGRRSSDRSSDRSSSSEQPRREGYRAGASSSSRSPRKSDDRDGGAGFKRSERSTSSAPKARGRSSSAPKKRS